MKRRAEGAWRRRVAVLTSIAVLGSMLAIVVAQAGAKSNKPYAVVICALNQSCPPGSPPVVSPGSTTGTPVTATITDETTKGAGLTIGSVNLTAPAGVTIASASLGTTIGACTATTPTTTSCISNGTLLELRGLNVPPGGLITVSMNITTPPPPSSCTTSTPCNWSTTAKQSNDYNGPPGNQLNLDSSSSQLGIVLSSETTCTSAKKSNSCSTTLADGGATGSTGGSVSITTSATGTSSGIFYQSIDYGAHLPANDCSNVDSAHDEYVSGAALNGTNARSFTVTITTTDYPGYQAQLCLTTSKQFTALFISSTGVRSTGPATGPLTQPDGTTGYAGLLADCQGSAGATAPTVNPKSQPCVLSRSQPTAAGAAPTHTIVASFPAGFDATMRN